MFLNSEQGQLSPTHDLSGGVGTVSPAITLSWHTAVKYNLSILLFFKWTVHVVQTQKGNNFLYETRKESRIDNLILLSQYRLCEKEDILKPQVVSMMENKQLLFCGTSNVGLCKPLLSSITSNYLFLQSMKRQ